MPDPWHLSVCMSGVMKIFLKQFCIYVVRYLCVLEPPESTVPLQNTLQLYSNCFFDICVMFMRKKLRGKILCGSVVACSLSADNTAASVETGGDKRGYRDWRLKKVKPINPFKYAMEIC